MSSKIDTVKDKMINYLKKTSGYNTFTAAQARRLFGIKNVAARIAELRQEGYCIYTNQRTAKDGRKVNVYRLGTPSKEMVRAAISAGYSFN